MKFRSVFLLFVLIVVACKEGEDPAPDDMSGAISFNYGTEYPALSLRVVISDSTGEVLQWAKLENGKKLELPYTAGDIKLLNVTLISTYPDRHSSEIYTFTGVAAGDYFKFTPLAPVKTQTGEHVIAIGQPSGSGYTYNYQFISGGLFKSSSIGPSSSDPYTWTYGLTGLKNDLLVMLARSVDDPWRYLYKTNVAGGQTTTINESDYESLPLIPVHEVNYPDNSDVRDYNLFLWGYDDVYNGSISNFVRLDDHQYAKGQPGTLRFPNTPGMFSVYNTVLSAYIDNEEVFTTSVTGPEPALSFSNLKAGITHVGSATTSRISLNTSGDADAVILSRSIAKDLLSVYWELHTEMIPNVHINPPKFPADLIEELPELALTGDESFDHVFLEDYGTSYGDYCTYFLNDLNANPPAFLSTRMLSVSKLNHGRRSSEKGDLSSALAKRYPWFHRNKK